MKRFNTVLLCFIMALLYQNASLAQSSLGLRAGLNIANLDGRDSDPKIGMDMGIVAEIGITESISFQPELHYLQKGNTINSQFGEGKSKATINYIQVPLLVKYVFGGENIRAYALAGPSIGSFAFYNYKDDDNEYNVRLENTSLKRFDFGLDFGVGLFKNTDSGKFFVDARYLLGLANISKERSTKTRGISIGVGYLWSFSK